jgi:hypothetical protein
MVEMNSAAENGRTSSRAVVGHWRAHSLRIEVPDAATGLALVRRLGHRCTLSGSDAQGWIVSGSANGNLPDDLAIVQEWLHDEAIDHVTVHLGDHTHSMIRD